jgi:thioredoxin-related protein
MTTQRGITWLDNIESAKKESAKTGRPVLMFFHYKYCTGCINTIGKTLPKMSVIDSVNNGFVPVMIETSERVKDTETYSINWTPTFVVADETGMETVRWEGYLPEDDFLGQLNMALAKVALKKHDYKKAEMLFDEVLLKYPLSDLAPEAGYFLGVVKYRATDDASWLTKAYNDLREGYPESVWAIKASVWSSDNIEAVKKAA